MDISCQLKENVFLLLKQQNKGLNTTVILAIRKKLQY